MKLLNSKQTPVIFAHFHSGHEFSSCATKMNIGLIINGVELVAFLQDRCYLSKPCPRTRTFLVSPEVQKYI